jgi:hypothetical protein
MKQDDPAALLSRFPVTVTRAWPDDWMVTVTDGPTVVRSVYVVDVVVWDVKTEAVRAPVVPTEPVKPVKP